MNLIDACALASIVRYEGHGRVTVAAPSTPAGGILNHLLIELCDVETCGCRWLRLQRNSELECHTANCLEGESCLEECALSLGLRT